MSEADIRRNHPKLNFEVLTTSQSTLEPHGYARLTLRDLCSL